MKRALGFWYSYVRMVYAEITITKDNLDGKMEGEVVLDYIHTYGATKGNFSITASEKGIGAGLSLTGVEKAWKKSCRAIGIPF